MVSSISLSVKARTDKTQRWVDVVSLDGQIGIVWHSDGGILSDSCQRNTRRHTCSVMTLGVQEIIGCNFRIPHVEKMVKTSLANDASVTVTCALAATCRFLAVHDTSTLTLCRFHIGN